MEKKLLEDYLKNERKLENFTVLYYEESELGPVYNVTIEDNTTKEKSILSIYTLPLLSFIYEHIDNRAKNLYKTKN